MIADINYETIFPIWRDDLWPNRNSPIETHSAMLHFYTEYDMGNFLLPAWYLGYYVNDKLIGVNSGHMCVDGSTRSRGLWVNPAFRGKGIGKQLLQYRINIIKNKPEISSIIVNTSQLVEAFYAANGFVRIAQEKDFWGVGIDLVRMEFQ